MRHIHLLYKCVQEEVPFNMKCQQQQAKTPMVFKQQQILWFLYTSSLYESVAPLVARRPLMPDVSHDVHTGFILLFFFTYSFFTSL